MFLFLKKKYKFNRHDIVNIFWYKTDYNNIYLKSLFNIRLMLLNTNM